MLKYLNKIFSVNSKKSVASYSFGGYGLGLNMNEDSYVGVDSYSKNVIVHRCVNLLAHAGSHVPWIVFDNKGNRMNGHPLHRLFKRPSPDLSGAEFFCTLIANKLLFGNVYILAVGDKLPNEMHILDSRSVSIVTSNGYKTAYRYNTGSQEYIYNIDMVSQHSRVLHVKNYNPSDSVYGLSVLEAAKTQINLHNKALEWNCSLLKNGARPTGALVMKDNNGYLTDEQFDRLRDQMYEKFSGSNNSGRPILLEGGLDWKEMSISPRDMDFIESKNSAAREIALAFGVPPQLLGINGDNTYSNMQEARLALWEETLLPLLDKLSDSLSNWLSNWYGDNVFVDIDRDAISALTDKRQNLWDKIAHADFMTINEKRALVGLPPMQHN